MAGWWRGLSKIQTLHWFLMSSVYSTVNWEHNLLFCWQVQRLNETIHIKGISKPWSDASWHCINCCGSRGFTGVTKDLWSSEPLFWDSEGGIRLNYLQMLPYGHCSPIIFRLGSTSFFSNAASLSKAARVFHTQVCLWNCLCSWRKRKCSLGFSSSSFFFWIKKSVYV
jgi:hypothetical protein